MEENNDQETAVEGLYKARKEAMQTGTEGMKNTEAEAVNVIMKKSTKGGLRKV